MSTLVKYLTFGLVAKSGRNSSGRKTVLHKIRWNKKRYRIIDFYRNNSSQVSLIVSVEKDPNRTAFISLICYKSGILSYILSIHGFKVGNFIDPTLYSLGSTMQLSQLHVGTIISSLEIYKNFGAKFIRAAGCFGVISNQLVNNVSIIKLPSGEERKVSSFSKATLGRISNVSNYLIKLNKASDSLRRGQKPVVRGVAKNAVDHPHGGGRGKTSNLATAVNFTGRVKKGVKSVHLYNKYRMKKRKKC